jgi:Fe-S-cluster-containing dehydrogenase component
MKILSIDLDRCVGCQNCELACSFYQIGDFRRERSNIWVSFYPEERFIVTLTCVQCEKPACKTVCPTRALRRDPETQAILVDEYRCIGCRMCMQVCPFGNIQMNPERRVIQKCNLCEGDPKCVRFCMGQAISFVDVDDLPEGKRKFLDYRLKRLHPVLGSGAEK